MILLSEGKVFPTENMTSNNISRSGLQYRDSSTSYMTYLPYRENSATYKDISTCYRDEATM
jgi:hypothetical protein